MKQYLFSAIALLLSFAAGAQAPLKLPALSPTTRVSQDFSVSSIELTYSRPSMRGRKIFGDLVQYGNVWRTGANGATKIKIGEDLEIAGNKIKAGEYALYTIPGKDKWEVILNTGTTNWGANGYSRDNDVARFFIKPAATNEIVQTFTISITDLTFTTCKIVMEWEKTRIVIPVVAHNSEIIETNIDKAINHPQPIPYFQSANYYFESDRKLDLAKMYVDKAVEQEPNAYFMWYLKARIEKKLGHDDDAVIAAKKSIETCKGNANEADNIRNNQKIIDDIRHRHHKQTIE